MKTKRAISTRRMTSILAVLTLLLATGTASAAQNLVYTFDDALSPTFSRWWGSAVQTYEFDATVDANGGAASGSQKITAVFDLAAYAGDNQFAAQFNASAFNGTEYTNLIFDIRFDPTSPVRQSGDYGALEYGLIPGDFTQIQLGTVTIPGGTEGWTRVEARIDPATPKLDNIIGFWFKIWSGQAGGLTGTSVIWIDNLVVNANTNSEPAPPPTISITKANPGMRLFASQPGAQYSRQNLYTRNSTGYSWVGAGQPVTYSLTIADYPGGAYEGFQSHIFLVPGSALPDWETSPDYNEPNLIFLDIGNAADGTGYASFRYKTNLPNGNTMVYNAEPANGPVGTLASIACPTPNGTWSLTFHNDTDITLTAPNGDSVNASIPADAVPLFADPLHFYAGVQPNRLTNIGQSLTFKRIQITGVPSPIDEDFSTPDVLLGTVWNAAAGDRDGLAQVAADADFWLSWSLPDNGWILQWAEDLENNFWNDIGLNGSRNIGGQRRSIVRVSDLPSSFFGHYFFQMIRR